MPIALITKANMFEPMLVADPSFLPEWQALLEDWDSDPEPPLYVALARLADHLSARMRHGDIMGLDRVFAVVEQWHVDGDQYVREAATIGFLEGLFDSQRQAVEPWLQPVSRKWWEKLHRFWDGDTGALRDTQ